MIRPVSFSGIYDIRFPSGTKPDYINRKADEAREFVNEQNLIIDGKPIIDVSVLDEFDCTKTKGDFVKQGIRIATNVDNPWILCSLFDKLDKRLGQEYVNKAKVELIFDTKA